MLVHLKRLVSTGAAYQLADVVSKLLALGLLPLYLRHLARADFGTAELLVTIVILVSIVVRLGLGESLVRYFFVDGDPLRQRQLAIKVIMAVGLTTTVASLAAAWFSEPLSRLILGSSHSSVLQVAALGLWAFSNLEIAYALLRAQSRARVYLVASLTNITLTALLTVWLVVFANKGAFGLLCGNFLASGIVLVGLWVYLIPALRLGRGNEQRQPFAELLRFGLPIIPAEVTIFALFVIDRLWLYRYLSPADAGSYTLAVKLASAIIFLVRAFQYAWPPLAYSIRDDVEAGRLYARIATYYALVCALVLSVLALHGRWLIKIFAGAQYLSANSALSWVALGWALYGLFLILVAMAGRAKITTRNVVPAVLGVVTNVVLLVLLTKPLGIAGAGIALVGAALVMLVTMYFLVRSLFHVAFEWRRLGTIAFVVGVVSVVGELALPKDGSVGLVLRAGCVCVVPGLLYLCGFFAVNERRALRVLVGRVVGRL